MPGVRRMIKINDNTKPEKMSMSSESVHFK